jgi:serine/threonine-protein kinase HipA
MRKQPYKSEHLFPFFTNLLPEGANRKVICRELRIDENDFFGMLMATVDTDMIGASKF